MLLTNNPAVQKAYEPLCKVTFIKGPLMDVMIGARNFVHQGYRLLSHPLSGSVKPNQTPYKSILLGGKPGPVDIESLRINEGALDTCRKLNVQKKNLPPPLLQDYMKVDYTLIESALSAHGLIK